MKIPKNRNEHVPFRFKKALLHFHGPVPKVQNTGYGTKDPHHLPFHHRKKGPGRRNTPHNEDHPYVSPKMINVGGKLYKDPHFPGIKLFNQATVDQRLTKCHP